jgi:hypothetical protein
MNGSSMELESSWVRSTSNWTLIGFAAIAAFFLITEHRAHVLGALPFGLFLLCPLLHNPLQPVGAGVELAATRCTRCSVATKHSASCSLMKRRCAGR